MPARFLTLLLIAAATVLALAGAGAAPAAAQTASVFGIQDPVGHGIFRYPQAITVSPGGRHVFVADQLSSVVQKFDRQGNWQGQFGYRADRGQLGRFGVIGGLATDRNNHVYVLDSENNRVQVFRIDTGEWLGAFGSSGRRAGRFRLGNNTGGGGLHIEQRSAGDVPVAYIADQYNHRVVKLTLRQRSSRDPSAPALPDGPRHSSDRDYVATPTFDRTWGRFGVCFERGCKKRDGLLLSHPQGITTSPRTGDVYVADDGNHRVVRYSSSGRFKGAVGTFGGKRGQFRYPYDVAVDRANQLYVADNNNHRALAFDADTLKFKRVWGGFGAGKGKLQYPRALTALTDDPLGGVFIADTANNRVQGFDTRGRQTVRWGQPGRATGYLAYASGVATDPAGDVYVADTWNSRIQKFSSDGRFIAQWARISPNSGFASRSVGRGHLRFPGALAFDPKHDHLWVADTGNDRVEVFKPDGTWVANFGGKGAADQGEFRQPRDIAVDIDGNVYVADTNNNRIQKRTGDTGVWSTVRLPGFSVKKPGAVSVDADGGLYVADTGNNRVLRFKDGVASVVPPPGGGLRGPSGLLVAGDELFVSETGVSRVWRLDLGSGRWEQIAGEGIKTGEFVNPMSLAASPNGDRLYVADKSNHRLQTLSMTVTPPAGLSKPGWTAADANSKTIPNLDRAAPVLNGPLLSRASFVPRPARGRRPGNAGTSISYALSEPAKVKLNVDRTAAGKIVGGKCRTSRGSGNSGGSDTGGTDPGATAPGEQGAGAPPEDPSSGTPPSGAGENGEAPPEGSKCTRYIALRGSLRQSGKAGLNTLFWDGWLYRKPLAAGRYRLRAAATDRPGNRSGEISTTFRVLRARR